MKINYREDFDEMWNVNDICEHLKIERKKAYKLFKISTFPGTKIGNTYIVSKRLYFKWLGEVSGKDVFL